MCWRALLLPLYAALFALVPVATVSAEQSYSSEQVRQLSAMVRAAKGQRWPEARDLSRKVGAYEATLAYEWLRLRKEGLSDFSRYAKWMDQHGGWPSERLIQRRAEELMGAGAANTTQIVGFFSSRPPVSGTGATRYAEALTTLGQRSVAVDVARDAWLTKDLTRDDELRLIALFPRELAPLHDQRLDELIWRVRLTAADRHLRRASPDSQRLARARISLLRGRDSVDGLVAAVPAGLKRDPGLAYARMVWRKKKGLRRSSEDMMLEMSALRTLGKAEKWADERALFVRKSLDDKAYKRAYTLAAGHGLDSGSEFAELEWLAGWVALRNLNRPADAQRHFKRLFENVSTPVSRARGAFWAGEAAREAGDNAMAERWYREAVAFPSAFYGQAARTRLRLPAAPELPSPIAARDGPCLMDDRVAVGSALAAGGDLLNARLFFYDLVERCKTVAEAKALGLHVESLGAFRVSVGMGRKLRGKSIFIPEIANPIVSLPQLGCKNSEAPERALTLAVARQESGFDATARSSAGALGLMQVMPATGRRVARNAGVAYSQARLGSDRNYNAHIGQCYLSILLERFEGSYPLVLAAYNAGPSRVKRWLKENGDPRRADVDAVEWIERIPFRETRNYVQRVLESLAVYRARLTR